jgi:hypothetical protein
VFTFRPWEYLLLWRELAFSYFLTSTVWWVHSANLYGYIFILYTYKNHTCCFCIGRLVCEVNTDYNHFSLVAEKN